MRVDERRHHKSSAVLIGVRVQSMSAALLDFQEGRQPFVYLTV
jgi:hypothetical protein